MPFSRFIRFRYLIVLAMFLVSIGVMSFKMPVTSFAKSSTHQRAVTPSARAWSIVASANQSLNNDQLSSVAAVSASDVWTVGYYFDSSGNPQTLIEQWNGTSWSIVASPIKGVSSYLYGVAAVSANNIWAVGEYDSNFNAYTLIEHWNGTSWSIVTSPNQTNYSRLYSVAAISANNIWAVGNYGNSVGANQTLTEHWNGTTWSIVASPDLGSGSNDLYSVSGQGNDIWAVGSFLGSKPSADQTLIEHWNGTSWSIVASPNQGTRSNYLYSVVAGAANDIWAVGYYISSTSGARQTLIEHWNGTSWSIVASPNQASSGNYLYSVAAVSPNNIWAVGDFQSSSNGVQQTLIEHWNGTSWSIVSSPNQGSVSDVLLGVARVPGSSNMWAVGYYSPTSIAQTSTLTEFYG